MRLAAQDIFHILFLKSKYDVNFSYSTQYVDSNAHSYLIRGSFSDKPCILAEIQNSHFVEILKAILVCNISNIPKHW